jgi:predicted phage terminase large subunit-like protein
MAKKLTASQTEIRDTAEIDLWFFAKLVNPHYQYGYIHEVIFKWIGEDGRAESLLLLMPRGHLKSHIMAVYTAWRVVCKPQNTFIYLSASEKLATAQIRAIKGMLTCKEVNKLWPSLINEREGDRDMWNAFAINVDHPIRKKLGIRDNTILVKTVKGAAAGAHCDELIFDDVVIPQNAYTELGRGEVASAVSQFGSVLNPGGRTTAVGTRYHPKDIYQSMKDATYPIWNEEKKAFEKDELPLWDINSYVVEDNGDLTGDYLWPRAKSPITNEFYGYDPQEVAKIKAKYVSNGERAQFFAQYYNEPNDTSNQRISESNFQYYDRKYIKVEDGKVFYKGNKLNVICSMDVAWTTNKRSDYTAIAVIGMDSEGFIYILDLDQYKTDSYTKYYESIMSMSKKWGVRKVIIETNSGGKLVSEEVKKHIRKNGEAIIVDGRYTTKSDGGKFERHAAIVEPRYMENTVFHYEGGYTPTLEEQIKLERPPYDDLLDAVTTCISNLKPPASSTAQNNKSKRVCKKSSKFGGRRRR